MAAYGGFIGSGTASVGSGDIFTRRGFSRRDTGGVSSSALGGHSSHVFIGSGGYFGGCDDISPRWGYSRRGFSDGGTGCTHVSGSGVEPPAVVGAAPTPPASDPSVGAGIATRELLGTEQEQLVTSGGRREVLAEVSRMAGGTSLVGPGASGPPEMVHEGGAGRRWQGQRVTPAVTRSQAKRDGLWPGMFALMATQEDITRSIAELSPPDVVEQELPSELAYDMETPETYV